MAIAAFFDIDGTIINANTQVELAKGLRKAHYLRFADLVKMNWWRVLYGGGFIKDSVTVRRKIYSSLPSISKNVFDQIIEAVYYKSIRPKISGGFFNIVKDHKALGHLTIAVSGTISNIAELVCRDLGIDLYYGTRLKVLDGNYTWDWEGDILEGKIKASFIKYLADKNKVDLKHSYFYTDHIADLPSLECVGFPIVVNGSHQLKRIALRNQWKTLKFN